MTEISIPGDVRTVMETLARAGFEAYLVGGCVRDILRGTARGEPVEPKDWDVATNATPTEIQGLFDDTVYENDFGTVLVKPPKPQINADFDADQRGTNNIRENPRTNPRESASPVEVTTYRIEGKYSDKRHPDEVRFAKTIEEDLSRRDFTVNAMAMKVGYRQSGIANREKENPIPDTRYPIPEIIDPFDGKKDLKAKIIRP